MASCLTSVHLPQTARGSLVVNLQKTSNSCPSESRLSLEAQLCPLSLLELRLKLLAAPQFLKICIELVRNMYVSFSIIFLTNIVTNVISQSSGSFNLYPNASVVRVASKEGELLFWSIIDFHENSTVSKF